MKKSLKEMNIFAAQIRKAALRAMNAFHGGHVGGSMSMSDLMAALYGEVMKVDPKNPQWEERDWLVVSKGHCGPAVYGTLALMGYFPEDELDTLNKEGTRLPSHCDRNRTPGIDMTTGSLGQGVSAAVGIAWGMQYQKKPNYVYTILGDGECDEGQVWEAALFAATKKLGHLIGFVDYNKKQLDGYTKDICDLGDLRQKFEDFGWHSQEVDGHDIPAIVAAIEEAKKVADKPSMIVLNTIKGKDCCFADTFYNHFVRFPEEDYEAAIKELDAKIAKLESEG
ncbi:transketolase [Agathobaculum sp. NSJ-28]|uniref:Transketolase n=2 Tax=Agathobaculum TaxID=2048137 RepID=A0A923RUP3_9FIRM|nr:MULTISPECIES: transketolase [Butyricicoccaceae]MBS6882062.1 transketolase [Clostridiaceae bacterium]SCI43416.1 Transketolase 1 [uncultured Butyricicoccus sp.]MBC5724078.1 transketolase [Agathobaculum faecis]MCU6787711.1 transketolase [Agathobaculum ammoniilyticum]WOC73975.1 transketolase [Intestinibacillus sp. NTUH-41-i26]